MTIPLQVSETGLRRIQDDRFGMLALRGRDGLITTIRMELS